MKKYLISLFLIFPLFVSAQTFDRDLYFGIQKDSDVTKLQEFLTEREIYSGPISGNFFSLTLRAVKTFQTQQGILPVSGYFGPKTRASANQILAAEGVNSAGVTGESGSTTPVTTVPPKTTNDVIASLTAQIQLLQQQLNALQQQQQTLQTIQQQQATQTQQITQQTQTLQQIQQQTASTPTPAPVPIAPPPDTTPPVITITSFSRPGDTGLCGHYNSCVYLETSKTTTAKLFYFPVKAVGDVGGVAGTKAIEVYAASNASILTDNNLSMKHTFNYKDLLSANTDYYMSIQVTDAAGNINNPPFRIGGDPAYFTNWNVGYKISGPNVNPSIKVSPFLTFGAPIITAIPSSDRTVFIIQHDYGVYADPLAWYDIRFTATSTDFNPADVSLWSGTTRMPVSSGDQCKGITYGCRNLYGIVGGNELIFKLDNIQRAGKLKITVTSAKLIGISSGTVFDAAGTPLDSGWITVASSTSSM